MVTIVDNQDRNKLNEGRDYQMGFAFCKKVAPKNFETIQPISPCKDYLNDVVFSEQTGKPVTAYGLNTSKTDLFKDDKYAYIAIKILGHKTNEYANQKVDTENLKANYKKLEGFVTYFSKALGLKVVKIYVANNGMYLVKFDKAWANYTYSISLFSLLLRIGQFYTGEVSELDFIKDFKAFPADSYLTLGMYPKLVRLLEAGKLVEQDLTALNPGTQVHNFGIAAFNF